MSEAQIHSAGSVEPITTADRPVRLSVIIVNYNVKHFLEQAIVSARSAAERVDTELIVVDNATADGSAEMVARRFPEVRLVRNADNVGFARANNRASRWLAATICCS